MRYRFRRASVGAALALALFSAASHVVAIKAAGETARIENRRVSLPALFLPNSGDLDSRVKYYSPGNRYAVFATDAGLAIALQSPSGERTVLQMGFATDRLPQVEAFNPRATLVNRLVGNRDRWRTAIPTYGGVRYPAVWAGIDLVAYAQPGRLKYELSIAPGADPSAIRLRYDGASTLRVTRDGALEIVVGSTVLRDAAPRTYQVVDGREITVPTAFVARNNGEFGFAVARYDRTRPLVIDPTLEYSTFIGGAGVDAVNAIAVGPSGAAFVAGSTTSSDFPTTVGVVQPLFAGGSGSTPTDAFVAKVSPAGDAFEYVTYVGGSGNDEAFGIAVDGSGNAYVTGYTESANFPVTSGVFSPAIGSGNHDGFLAKLNPSGSSLVYSTFFGWNGATQATAVAVDPGGNAYVVGWSLATNITRTAGNDIGGGFTSNGTRDAFLEKFNADASTITYGTALGGDKDDVAVGVGLDADGHAFVAGWTQSLNLITTNTAVQRLPNSATFKSIDGGQTFVPDNDGPDPSARASEVLAVAIDPQRPAIVYEGTRGTGLLKSTDGGNTWQHSVGPLPVNATVSELAIDPNNSDTMFAVVTNAGDTTSTLMRSTNADLGFTAVATNVRRVAIAASNSSFVFATRDADVIKSADGGQTWKSVLAAPALSVTVDPTNSSIAYVGTTNSNVRKTTNGGETWSVSSIGSSIPENVNVVAVDPSSPNVVWAGAGSTYKSTDGGRSWSYQGLAPFGLTRMVFDGSTLYAAGPNAYSAAVGRTSDQGAHWSNYQIHGSLLPVEGFDARSGSVIAGTVVDSDAFAYKIDTNATSRAGALIYGTYVGGSRTDRAVGLAVNPSGEATIAMITNSTDVAVTLPSSPRPIALARLSADGTAYKSFTYVGPTRFPVPTAVTADAGGTAYVAGTFDDGPVRAFVDRIDASGLDTAEVSLTGCCGTTRPNALAADASGAVYVAGFTTDATLPSTPAAAQPSYRGNQDGFISKVRFSASGDVPPSVSITSPASGASFTLGTTISIAGAAADTDGTISQVTLFANGTSIGYATTSPFSINWNPTQSGTYALQAVATDNGDAQTTSAPVIVTFGPAGSGLPAPWVDQDVGPVGSAGSASYNGGRFTVRGAGTIWGTSDTFNFLDQPVSGDVVVDAQVVSMENTDPFAKAGIMIRASAAPDAAHVILDVRPTGDVEFMTRSTNGAATTFIATARPTFPMSLRLVRTGASVSAFVAGYGGSWTSLGSTPFATSGGALAGVVVGSNTSAVNTSLFQFVSVTPGGNLQSPWTDVDIGPVGTPGGASQGAYTLTVSGSGTIWGTSDTFNFVEQPFSGDVTVTTQVTAMQNTDPFAKAGIMIRESNAPNAAHVILDLRPTGDLEFMTRSSTGATTTFLGTGHVPGATYLTLARVGNTVTASYSYSTASGYQTVTIGSTTLNVGSTVLVGVVVGSNTAATATATFTGTIVGPGPGGAPPPPPWTHQDVGDVGTPGTATYATGDFTVKGAGTIWGTADAFHFVEQPIAGDAAIVARVPCWSCLTKNPDPFAKAGVMIRASNAADAAHVILDLRPTGDIEFMTRPSPGAETTFLGTVHTGPSTYLRLVRRGTTVTAAVSPDGTLWTIVGSTTLDIASDALVGLVVGSNTSAADAVLFNYVSVTNGALSPPWASQDIGSPGAAGSAQDQDGVFTVRGAGTIWGTSDSFHFAYQPVVGDFHVIARVTSMDNTNTFAKAGLMIRESLAPNAAHVILDLRPSNDLEFMIRPAAGQETVFLNTAVQPPPTWLQLQRTGATIAASVSADGSTWTVVGSTTLDVASAVYVGLAVCSVTDQLNTAVWDHVVVR